MIRFLLKRLISSFIVLVVVSFMAYFLIYLAPGDPATIALARQLGRMPSAEQVAHLRAEYGLDKPPIVQYLNWLLKAIQGDFGYSIRTKNLVMDEVSMRFPHTLLLTTVTVIVAVLVAIPTGFLAAWHKKTILDHAIRVAVMLAVAIPDFWLAFLLILIFSMSLQWLPTHGVGSVQQLVMPVICLVVANAARLNRLTRSGLLEVERESYLLTARAKGRSRRAAWLHHGFPNIAVPIVTLIATLFSGTFAASIIIEQVFAWPGMGPFFVQAVSYRDLPVIQALMVLYSAVFVLLNLLADIAYVMIDPRIRLM